MTTRAVLIISGKKSVLIFFVFFDGLRIYFIGIFHGLLLLDVAATRRGVCVTTGRLFQSEWSNCSKRRIL